MRLEQKKDVKSGAAAAGGQGSTQLHEVTLTCAGPGIVYQYHKKNAQQLSQIEDDVNIGYIFLN